MRLGTKKDSIETEIRALDDDILILQRQRGDKISELSRVQEEQRTTFESFKTHSAASTEPGIPSLPQHESPTTAATQKKPRNSLWSSPPSHLDRKQSTRHRCSKTIR